MWLFTDTGFVSIVQAYGDPTVLTVRARVKADLAPIIAAHETHHHETPDVHTRPGADYPWRLLTSRAVVQAFMREAIDRLDYHNFKGAIVQQEPDGVARERVYHHVWEAALDLEELDPPKDRQHAETRFVSLTSDEPWVES